MDHKYFGPGVRESAAAFAPGRTVVGLDIGTTKVCTIIGYETARGLISIDGIGTAPSLGMEKGVVVDIEKTISSIKESVSRAEDMAGVQVESVVAGITGDHIESANYKGAVAISAAHSTLTDYDIERVLEAAAMDIAHDREIIHSLPRTFTVDGHTGVRRPIGMYGRRLEVETHIVTGTPRFLNDLVRCIENAELHVESLILEPVATSEALITPEERDLGVALLDIGGGTSDIAVFSEGNIVYSNVIPAGGNHVTRDISIGLRTPFEIAERLKIERGAASPAQIPHEETLEVVLAGSGERQSLPRTVLGEIIEARMLELLEMAHEAMGGDWLQSHAAAGVILTGGGSLLPGIVEQAQQVFQVPVRIGKPLHLETTSDRIDSPQYATAIGLLRFAIRQSNAQDSTQIHRSAQRRIWSAPVPLPPPSYSPEGLELLTQNELTAQNQEELLDSLSEASSANRIDFEDGDEEETEDIEEFHDGDEEEPLWRKALHRFREWAGFE